VTGTDTVGVTADLPAKYCNRFSENTAPSGRCARNVTRTLSVSSHEDEYEVWRAVHIKLIVHRPASSMTMPPLAASTCAPFDGPRGSSNGSIRVLLVPHSPFTFRDINA